MLASLQNRWHYGVGNLHEDKKNHIYDGVVCNGTTNSVALCKAMIQQNMWHCDGGDLHKKYKKIIKIRRSTVRMKCKDKSGTNIVKLRQGTARKT